MRLEFHLVSTWFLNFCHVIQRSHRIAAVRYCILFYFILVFVYSVQCGKCYCKCLFLFYFVCGVRCSRLVAMRFLPALVFCRCTNAVSVIDFGYIRFMCGVSVCNFVAVATAEIMNLASGGDVAMFEADWDWYRLVAWNHVSIDINELVGFHWIWSKWNETRRKRGESECASVSCISRNV